MDAHKFLLLQTERNFPLFDKIFVLPLVKEDNHFFLRLREVIVETDFKKLIIKYQSNSFLRNPLT